MQTFGCFWANFNLHAHQEEGGSGSLIIDRGVREALKVNGP